MTPPDSSLPPDRSLPDTFEAFDRTWKVPGKSLDLARLRAAAEDVATQSPNVQVQVNWEDDDTVTCFFTVPLADSTALTVELSVYDLRADGRVLSLEADASDNDADWEQSCQLAEDLAEALDAQPLVL